MYGKSLLPRSSGHRCPGLPGCAPVWGKPQETHCHNEAAETAEKQRRYHDRNAGKQHDPDEHVLGEDVQPRGNCRRTGTRHGR